MPPPQNHNYSTTEFQCSYTPYVLFTEG